MKQVGARHDIIREWRSAPPKPSAKASRVCRELRLASRAETVRAKRVPRRLNAAEAKTDCSRTELENLPTSALRRR